MHSLPLAAVIDMHCHTGPDSIPRNLDALDLARLAAKHGMQGIVLKNHFEPTASLARMVQKLVPEIDVFGGIALNLSVGGINAEAVERMALVEGGCGRVVWMGSVDTEAQRHFDGSNKPAVSISRYGELVDETLEVLKIISRYQLILATGHYLPDDIMLLIRAAKNCGVTNVVVTHAMMAPIHMTLPQMQAAAEMGAYIEFAYNGLIGPHKEFSFSQYANAIRSLGPHVCILSSDLGQITNPAHPDGFLAFLDGLREEGFGNSELDCMCKTNPSRLLSSVSAIS